MLAPGWRQTSPEYRFIYTLGREKASSLNLSQPLTKVGTLGKCKASTDLSSHKPSDSSHIMNQGRAGPHNQQKLKGSCSSSLGPHPTPDRAVTVSEHMRSPCWNWDVDLSPPTPTLLPTIEGADRTPQGKSKPMLTADLALPRNPLGTADCIGTLSHKDTPLGMGEITFSPNIIEVWKQIK